MRNANIQEQAEGYDAERDGSNVACPYPIAIGDQRRSDWITGWMQSTIDREVEQTAVEQYAGDREYEAKLDRDAAARMAAEEAARVAAAEAMEAAAALEAELNEAIGLHTD